jgi:hypothetical protein
MKMFNISNLQSQFQSKFSQPQQLQNNSIPNNQINIQQPQQPQQQQQQQNNLFEIEKKKFLEQEQLFKKKIFELENKVLEFEKNKNQFSEEQFYKKINELKNSIELGFNEKMKFVLDSQKTTFEKNFFNFKLENEKIIEEKNIKILDLEKKNKELEIKVKEISKLNQEILNKEESDFQNPTSVKLNNFQCGNMV